MPNEVLVYAVKQIMALSKGGDEDAAHAAYADLFTRPEFATYRAEDQRQALKLLILAKRSGAPSEHLLEAVRAALPLLTSLIASHSEPADYEMAGVCHLLLDEPSVASKLFRQGLERERASNPQSVLCGRLMTRVSSI